MIADDTSLVVLCRRTCVSGADFDMGLCMCRDLDTFKRVFDVNVFGAFAAMQSFVPFLKVRSPHAQNFAADEPTLRELRTTPAS